VPLDGCVIVCWPVGCAPRGVCRACGGLPCKCPCGVTTILQRGQRGRYAADDGHDPQPIHCESPHPTPHPHPHPLFFTSAAQGYGSLAGGPDGAPSAALGRLVPAIGVFYLAMGWVNQVRGAGACSCVCVCVVVVCVCVVVVCLRLVVVGVLGVPAWVFYLAMGWVNQVRGAGACSCVCVCGGCVCVWWLCVCVWWVCRW
jgi:hypothetical protein